MVLLNFSNPSAVVLSGTPSSRITLSTFSPDFMAGGREFHEQKERDWGGVFGSDPADADESPKSTDGA